MPSNRLLRCHVKYTAHVLLKTYGAFTVKTESTCPVKTDGSEDGCIQCIKPDRVVAGAARDVSEGTAKFDVKGLEEDC